MESLSSVTSLNVILQNLHVYELANDLLVSPLWKKEIGTHSTLFQMNKDSMNKPTRQQTDQEQVCVTHRTVILRTYKRVSANQGTGKRGFTEMGEGSHKFIRPVNRKSQSLTKGKTRTKVS